MRWALPLLLLHWMTPQDILTRPSPPADHRIAFGSDPLQFGELRLPPGKGPFPVVVVIHGGCWRAQYDLVHIGNLAAALTSAGAATWTLEYRRLGNPGGGWPGTFDDIVHGAGYVKTLAQKYPLDLERAVAIGHSAGGHLVLWLAKQKALKLAGVVSLAGVADLRRAAQEHVCGDAVSQLVGGVEERYAQASPMELLPLGVPTRLIHGVGDRIVPPEYSRDYAAAARKKGDDVSAKMVTNAGHFEVIDPASSAWKTVESTVLELLALVKGK